MWYLYALTFAVASSFAAIIAKRGMRSLNEYQYLWLSGLFTIPFLLLIILYFYQIPSVDNVYILAVSGSIFLDIFAAIFAYRAIKIAEVSLVAPMAAFNPVFTALISWFVLHEVIQGKGILGILLICIGAYLLQVSKLNKDWLGPIKTLLNNQAVRLSLLAYFIWAVTPIFQKIAIAHTDPQVPPFVSLTGLVVTNIVFGIIAFKKTPLHFGQVREIMPLLLIVGVLAGVGQAAAFMAFSLTNLGYATAIFKLSMVFTVILGWLFFKEKNIKDRLLGSLVMLFGVYLLIS